MSKVYKVHKWLSIISLIFFLMFCIKLEPSVLCFSYYGMILSKKRKKKNTRAFW